MLIAGLWGGLIPFVAAPRPAPAAERTEEAPVGRRRWFGLLARRALRT
jgi:hypothetical protein